MNRILAILPFLFSIFSVISVSGQETDGYLKNKKSKILFEGNNLDAKKSSNTLSTITRQYPPIEINKTISNSRFSIFNQTYNGIEIFSATIKENYDNGGNLIITTDNTINFTEVDSDEFPLVNEVPNYSNIKENEIISSTKIYFPVSENKIIPALKIEFKIDSKVYLSIFDSEYNIVYNKTLSIEKDIITKTANASVFLPDPITSAGVIYGNPYYHNSGATNPSLEAEQVNVEFESRFDGTTYYLENDFAKIVDSESPNWNIITSTDGNFNLTRNQIGFQQVNAFYHINEIKKHINSLGFTDAVNFQINVDADGEDGDDNSHFNPSGYQGSLTFGAYYLEGSSGMEHVPDAEDAEVVVHEYTHAIINSYNISKISNERRCLEEAMADYIAVSYARNINPYRWEDVFKWDGHNEFWNGRKATSTKCYNSISFSNIYQNTDIWVAPLMDLYTDLGKTTTDELVLHTITALESNTTMEQAALIMMKMDTVYNSNVNAMAIFESFKKYCILNDSHLNEEDLIFSSFKVINSQSFANGGELTIEFGYLFSGEINLFNINGNNILNKDLLLRKNFKLSSKYLNSGIYLINIKNSEGSKTIKICKY